jgi:hypothetical protein
MQKEFLPVEYFLLVTQLYKTIYLALLIGKNKELPIWGQVPEV